MSLHKRTYTARDQNNPVPAQNLNDIQQEIINTCSYATCSTHKYSPSKTVSVPGFELFAGCCIKIKFNDTNSVANPTLNVSETGAKDIFRQDGFRAGTTEGTSWRAGYIITLIYDGAKWIIIDQASGIGNLANLLTSSKTDLVSAINEIDSDLHIKHVFGDLNSGSYCKLPDGTLIQWIANRVPRLEMSHTIVFPTPFYDTNYLFMTTVTVNNITNAYKCYINSVVKSVDRIEISYNFRTVDNMGTYTQLVLIGRWK